MAKGKSTWKYNKLLTARRNYFGNAGYLETPSANIDIPNRIPSIPQGDLDALKAGIPVRPEIQKQVNQIQNSGDSTWTAGGITGAAGFMASAIGNMTNNILANDVKAKKQQYMTDASNSMLSGQTWGTSYDTLEKEMAYTPALGHVDKYDMGAKDNLAVFGSSIMEGLKGSAAGFSAGGGSFSAYGGPINKKYMGGGPIGAIIGGVLGTGMSLIGDLVHNHKAAKAAGEVNDYRDYVSGYNDRILSMKGDNIGNLQANNLLRNYTGASSNMFNSAAYGGELNIHGADFTNGLLHINEGGTHEQNPYEGVLMGIDNEGTPNLVEEGETIFNDYVFSKRIMTPLGLRKKYKFGGKLSFADATKKLAKESEERPNDPISQNGLEYFMAELAQAQEQEKQRQQLGEMMANIAAYGGKVNKFDGKSTLTNKMAKTESDNAYNNLVRAHQKEVLNYLISMPEATDEEKKAKKNAIKKYIEGYNNTNKSYLNNISKYGVQQDEEGNIINWAYNNPAVEAEGIKEHQKLWDEVGGNDAFLNDSYKDHFEDAEYSLDSYNKKFKPDGKSGRLTSHRYFNLYDDASPEMQEIRDLQKQLGIVQGDREAGIFDIVKLMEDETIPGTPNTEVPAVTPAERNAVVEYYLRKFDSNGLPVDKLIDNYDPDSGLYDYVRTDKSSDDTTDYTKHYFKEKEKNNTSIPDRKPTWMREAPLWASGIRAFTDALGLTGQADYSNIPNLQTQTPQIGFTPVGNQLKYTPYDTYNALNQLNASAGANRRAQLQNAGLNRGLGAAALLAADNNLNNSIGTTYATALDYNNKQRQAVEEFNRGTNTFNSEGMLKADSANLEAALKGNQLYSSNAWNRAQMRETERVRAYNDRQTTLNTFLESLQNYGLTNENLNSVRGLTEAGVWGAIAKEIAPYFRGVAAKGGKIKRNRKGLTY